MNKRENEKLQQNCKMIFKRIDYSLIYLFFCINKCDSDQMLFCIRHKIGNAVVPVALTGFTNTRKNKSIRQMVFIWCQSNENETKQKVPRASSHKTMPIWYEPTNKKQQQQNKQANKQKSSSIPIRICNYLTILIQHYTTSTTAPPPPPHTHIHSRTNAHTRTHIPTRAEIVYWKWQDFI